MSGSWDPVPQGTMGIRRGEGRAAPRCRGHVRSPELQLEVGQLGFTSQFAADFTG